LPRREQGHVVHFTTVAKLLGLLGYSLQANVKTREGAWHPDRDAQFKHIDAVSNAAPAAGQPVISVDTKKKKLVGDFTTPAASGDPRARPSSCGCTTSKTNSWARRSPTASMTSPQTRVTSASPSTRTPPSV
jgi:hypothetical protein